MTQEELDSITVAVAEALHAKGIKVVWNEDFNALRGYLCDYFVEWVGMEEDDLNLLSGNHTIWAGRKDRKLTKWKRNKDYHGRED